MQQLPAELRFVVRGDRVAIDDVAWLDVVPASEGEDAIVEDRLERAARAEFADRDPGAAARQFDELLAAPLPNEQRMHVLAAAAWQARRAHDEQRFDALAGELRELLGAVDGAQLARPRVANAVASFWRLRDGAVPVAVQQLVPLLPQVTLAALGIDDGGELRERRRLARLAQRGCARLGAGSVVGMFPCDDGRSFLWLLPADGGLRDAAVVTPEQWYDAVRAAGERDVLFAVPDGVQVDFAGVDATERLGGIPGCAKVHAGSGLLGSGHSNVLALLAILAGGFLLALMQLIRAGRRESQAVAAQAQFLTTVTHELKTPLAGIRLLGEMLCEGRAKGREGEYYRLLVGESARLSMLIDNVLDLSRLEGAGRKAALRGEPIGDVVRETLAMFSPLAEQDGVAVEFRDDTGDVSARIDRQAFVQALVAVLDNARKYGKGGGRIDVVAKATDREVLVDVRDHGVGVPAVERERIFERFVRGRNDAHGSQPGVGIGLYIARHITALMGGELACFPPDDGGAGALFRFRLQQESGR